jgi:hypothetical protein
VLPSNRVAAGGDVHVMCVSSLRQEWTNRS